MQKGQAGNPNLGRRVIARETELLGRWLGDGLPSWGKVGTHLDRVSPFWWVERLANLNKSLNSTVHVFPQLWSLSWEPLRDKHSHPHQLVFKRKVVECTSHVFVSYQILVR
jgi:hypothetical protein